MSTWIRVCVIVIVLLTLTSCLDNSESAEHLLQNYLWRLANSLDVEQQKPTIPASLTRYPVKRKLTQPTDSSYINLLDFLQLSRCELQRHIGQRNSSLGQVMAETQQWIYELEFIELAAACLKQLPDNSELSLVIKKAIQQKQTQLSKTQWNATFGSKEFNRLFSLSTEPLTLSELKQSPTELFNALEKLIRLKNQENIESNKLESIYRIIASTRYLGAIRLSIQQATDALQAGNNLLTQRLDKPLCYDQKSNKKFDIVETVFQKFYIGQAQPYFANLHQQAGKIFYLIDKLAQNQTNNTAFNEFWAGVYQDSESEWQTFNAAIKNHTQHWQQLLKQCGKLPGRD